VCAARRLAASFPLPARAYWFGEPFQAAVQHQCERIGKLGLQKTGRSLSPLSPFAPYQFQLLQRIFQAIRKAGADGFSQGKDGRGSAVVTRLQHRYDDRLLPGYPRRSAGRSGDGV
jgi:hypothetical protein